MSIPDDRWRWLLMLLRRIGMLLVTETERELGMEPSMLTKKEREQRKVAIKGVDFHVVMDEVGATQVRPWAICDSPDVGPELPKGER